MKENQDASSCTDHVEQFLTTEHQHNSFVLSRLKNFYEPVVARGFAIKYVTEGVEHYRLGNDAYTVKAGQYLLSNLAKDGKVAIESKQLVTGVCINLVPALLAEVIASRRRPDTAESDLLLGAFFTTDYFLENQYDAAQTALGRRLKQVDAAISQNNFQPGQLDIEFFYSIAESIVDDQVPIFKQLQSIPGIKPATKKDLYKRLHRSRELMDALFTTPLSIQMIAREACLSEYHFFRLFKRVYGVSPLQYIIGKRMQLGKTLLQQGGMPVTTIAAECGFADIFSFSKAYRKYHGMAPSQMRDQK